ncbi:hypothetical protein SAMD00019534_005360 [Acytostelium subglobosum LB1]|uniref:hypothetical protein n=1 Tax=Acytostelium subglobosum LB1 TaxID=1410327 RepID=UPI000644E461|nr:hypothetical protein SAMD00019534_005360 [Acytostelium subglobosum LB1]GAM17361.1 hypothetical protein SAMD00019534_005360 [Acytostelium subglobosum LB1]|eukprot:XP_012759423.1 hypothetical protein SAMD00019534_005360 [Acytostelium subglobosum LB1]
MDVVVLKEEEVELLEKKLRDQTTGVVPKLNGDDILKASALVDWLVSNMQLTRPKAAEYGQMLWNRGVFDHVAPHPFRDDDQLFRLKQNEQQQQQSNGRRSTDENQWTQLKHDAPNKDVASADPIAKLHKSIENATKVYQKLLREKNQASSPNTLLGLRLLDQTLNLIAAPHNNTTHQHYNQILSMLQNPTISFVAQNGDGGVASSGTPDNKSAAPAAHTAKKSTTTTDSHQQVQQQQQQGGQGGEPDVDEILAVSEKIESGLLEQLRLAHQQTNYLKQMKKTKTGGAATPAAAGAATTAPSGVASKFVPATEESISLQRQRSSSYFGTGALKGIDLAPVVIGCVENKFPKYLIAETKNDNFVFTINGPAHDQLESANHSCFNSHFFARTISTYPHLPGHPKREGDPICDHFCVQVQSTRVIAAVADGCNWGIRPAEAALKASTSFVEFISRALSSEIQTVQDAGNQILSAFNYAHNKIIDGKTDIWEAGTTTLIGGVMVELLNDSSTVAGQQAAPLSRSVPVSNAGQQKDLTKTTLGSPRDNTPPSKWGFICASVGDCKAFHFNHATKKFVDITKGNRQSVDDCKDPGGRLGPYVANGHPDLRNLCLHFLPCQENDIIILVSDGVHDNLDPQTIGVQPKDIQLPHESWESMDAEKAQESKIKYMQEFLKMKLRTADVDDPLTSKMIVEKLLEHCFETTRSSRDFMETFPNRPLPEDLKAYPGKMDHTTCVAFRVGKQSL